MWTIYSVIVCLSALCTFSFAQGEDFKLYNRLPTGTFPEHYDIKLTTNVHAGEKRFHGEVGINIVVVSDVSEIVLHARHTKISKATIVSQSTGESEELLYQHDVEREFLTFKRKNASGFAAGTKWKLIVAYSGQLGERRAGFYLSKYRDNEGKDRFLATTQFDKINARHAFPCYDEPNIRSNFTITIRHSPTYTAISNMPVNEALSSDGETVFLTTAPIPTYAVAFVVSDFVYSERLLNDIPHRVYARPNAKSQSHKWALVSGLKIANHLSKYYDVDPGFPKIDHVAVPDFDTSATGNWGLATYREENLLCDNDTIATNAKAFVARAVAKTISVQWFGSYVTINWWTDLWLKEGLATLVAYKALEHTHPELDLWQEFHTDEYEPALTGNGKYSAKPLITYTPIPTELDTLRDLFVYSTAASILFMWNSALGDGIFQKGLKTFVVENQYRSVTQEQLFNAIQTATQDEDYRLPVDVARMMSTWTKQAGYPILTVTRNYESGTFKVKQEGFCDNGLYQEKKWFVPINYAVASNWDFSDTKATHFLLNVNETKLNDVNINAEDWLILNKQTTGFYRINYDVKNWDLIAEGLIKRPLTIHVRNRAQLLNDAYHFTLTKHLDHSTFLKLLSYLKQETEYAPWSAATKIFKKYNGYLSGDGGYDRFKLFVSEQVGPIYRKLGVNYVVGEPHYNKYTRPLVINLACSVGLRECLEETNNKLKNVVLKNETIEYYLRSAIYCNGLRQSSDELYDVIYQELMDSTDPTVRMDLIYALGCTEKVNQINKFVHSSIDESNNLSADERHFLLFPVYIRHEVGLLTCIDFLSENWVAFGNMKNDYGLNPLESHIRQMSLYVRNEQQEAKLLNLLAKINESQYDTTSLIIDVKQNIARNFKWLEENGEGIMSWIAQYHATSGSGSRATTTIPSTKR